ncbi:MAG: bifunctional 23S rRNA (guanine(2069)-N(7))-methyltransferase RlmK/23S rRNA (guanine(2445)-N(2))-methyltransferase RlmL [Sulfuriflexus sp.]|nr:bifunctional 23S rRNA (guanine(2069)-N(7))-methyltransferase RlmK/23S rRNA (guanine(2445)-N(2))-methyltransferase RlmL [Sulfuriflexus sp.]
MKLFVSAPRGTTDLLGKELQDLGATALKVVAAGAHCEADTETLYRICLWSRIANRVLLPIATFKAGDTDALYDGAQTVNWQEVFPVTATFSVHCTLTQSVIDHSHYASLKVKDAIVDQFRDETGERPSVDTDNPDIRINLHIRRREAQIALDLSGGSLHRRGYREAGGEAPLKENLAASLLMFAGWPSQQALFDPMCGSGTLLIEGAMMAADIAPGLLREGFGFEHWSDHDETLWQQIVTEAEQRREKGLEKMQPIRGQDADKNAIRKSIANITRAGLQAHIHVETCVLNETGALPAALMDVEQGLLICNPPYGERVAAMGGLRLLYAALGKLKQRQLENWHEAIFTGSPELALYHGQVADEVVELNNGPIDCELLIYNKPDTLEKTGGEMFANRLRKNMKKFSRWAKREQINCYRVYDADLPEFAVAVDLYYSDRLYVHVQEYTAPKTVDATKALRRLQAAFTMLPEVFDVSAEQISFRQRRRQSGKGQYNRLAGTDEFHKVEEGHCQMWVNFADYLDTGLFLDHRITRKIFGELSAGKRVLNLYCYTATASLQAIAYGATESVSVDMSRTYLDWAQKNYSLNNVDIGQHRLIRDDCIEWLETAKQDKKSFDVIFIDPPTFSNSKRLDKEFDIQRDHVRLINLASKLLTKGGVILFSNNFRRFKLEESRFLNLKAEDISLKTIPEDFARRKNIHRCWKITQA